VYKFLKISINDLELKHIVEKYDFSNIPDSEKGPEKFNRIATPGTWKTHFDDNEKHIMNSIMGKKLSEFGYND